MRVNKMIAAATLPAMIASPVAAANPAASLSLRSGSGETAPRTDATAQPASELVGGGIGTTLLLGGLAVAIVVAAAVALGHHHNHPASA